MVITKEYWIIWNEIKVLGFFLNKKETTHCLLYSSKELKLFHPWSIGDYCESCKNIFPFQIKTNGADFLASAYRIWKFEPCCFINTNNFMFNIIINTSCTFLFRKHLLTAVIYYARYCAKIGIYRDGNVALLTFKEFLI